MKKLLSALVATIVTLCMAGCGSGDSSSNNSSLSESTASTTQSTTTTTEPTTTTTASTTTKLTTTSVESSTQEVSSTIEANSIGNTESYVNAIGEKIEITDVTKMSADVIGAEEGTSFKYNGNKFEIYLFSEGNPKLDEAANGSLTYTVEGFGDFTSNAIVKGNYVMLFNTADDVVSNVFKSL